MRVIKTKVRLEFVLGCIVLILLSYFAYDYFKEEEIYCPYPNLVRNKIPRKTIPPIIGPQTWSLNPAPTQIPTDIISVQREYMSDESFIIVSFLDESYIDVALNFYENNILKHNIQNFMFVSQSRTSCEVLFKQNILCVLYEEKVLDLQFAEYKSSKFRQRMNVRAAMLMKLLDNDISVLLTDSDIVYFKDPRGYLLDKCDGADICAQQDGKGTINAGFILLRPTKLTKQVLQRRIELAGDVNTPTDQEALNQAVKEFEDLKLVKLDDVLLQNGKDFFEINQHYFSKVDDEPSDLIIMHNNYIVSRSAKIYRFKEIMRWHYDEEQYYSNPNTKYLLYENPEVGFWYSQRRREKNALHNALAIADILNRTLILPAFKCPEFSVYGCPFNMKYNVQDLDMVYQNKYREHVFLNNPKVPSSVVSSLSKKYFIASPKALKMNFDLQSDVTVIPTKDTDITNLSIKDMFSSEKDVSVLRFHSLYYAFDKYVSEIDDNIYRCKMKTAIQEDVQRQTKHIFK